MNELTTLQKLKSIDPGHHYYMGAITGVVFCDVDDMAIHNPFVSPCGRFPTVPSTYGIPMKAALIMADHNLPLGDPEGVLEGVIEA